MPIDQPPFLGVCLIVRNAAPTIEALLASIQGAFDELVIVDTGSTDDTCAIISMALGLPGDAWPARVEGDAAVPRRHQAGATQVVLGRFHWFDDFAAARNYSFSLATATWRGYLDADDTFPLAPRLRPTLARTVREHPEVNCLCLPYDYGEGELLQDKWRFVRWADGWTWTDEIHEYLVRVPAGQRMISKIDDLLVIHNHSEEHTMHSLERNIRICTAVRARALAAGDTRKAGLMAYYLGAYEGAIGDPQQALAAYAEATAALGDSNLSCEARVAAARLCLVHGDLEQALNWAVEAAGRNPEMQEGHAILGVVQMERGDIARAVAAFDRLFATPEPLMRSTYDTLFMQGVVPTVAVRAYVAHGNLDQALVASTKFDRNLMAKPKFKGLFAAANTKLTQAIGLCRVRDFVDYLLWDTESLKALAFLDSAVPAAIAHLPEIGALRQRITTMIPQMRGWDAYQQAYSSIPEQVYHTGAELYDFVHNLDRTKTLRAWAAALPHEGPPVSVLTVGPQDCLQELEMLEANPRIRLTVAEVAPQANAKIQELAARFPGRVDQHAIKDSEYDWAPARSRFRGVSDQFFDHFGRVRYDAVVIFEVLEHLPDDRLALRYLAGLLAPGGTLFLSTPIAEYWIEPHLTEPGSMSWGNWYQHVRAHNQVSLHRLFRDEGFSGHIEATETKSTFLCQMTHTGDETRERHVAIYVPSTPLPFDPESHLHGHLGGSEEAVLYLAPELFRLGYEVTVYAPRPHRDDHRAILAHAGVLWRPSEEFDPHGDHQRVIFWRCPGVMADERIKSASYKKFCWAHDVGYRVGSEMYAPFDEVIVLSQFHGKVLHESNGCPPDKFKYAANGIDLAMFPPLTAEDEVARDPYKAIYASSQDRGLDQLIKAWPLIKRAVPQATLDVYYSWQLFDQAVEKFPSVRAKYGTVRRDVEALADQGVTIKGGVDHRTLSEAYRHAGVFAYPCTYEEIFCISVVKAQAAGCWPVVPAYAALPEIAGADYCMSQSQPTVEEYAAAVIDKMLHPPTRGLRRAMAEQARARFSWQRVAQMFAQIIG